MKKKLTYNILFILIIVLMVSCSKKESATELLNKEGVAPYELSKSERYLLQTFAMENSTKLISFHAPKDAIRMCLNVYQLEDDYSWKNICAGEISIDTAKEPINELIGTLAIHMKDDYSMILNINSGSVITYNTPKNMISSDIIASEKIFIDKYKKVKLNKEVPIALMVYNSNEKIESYTIEDFFNPKLLEGTELVQAVTLTFLNK